MDISNYNIEQCDAVSVLNAIMDMHDHPQKIDQIAAAISPIAAAAAAYSEGKPQLAQAITRKGVTTQPTDSLAQMAQNINQISHQPIIWNDGDIAHMYEKQMFGNLTIPNYWNLYEVMKDLLNSTDDWNASTETGYGGIMLCEYYKGHDSISMSGNFSAGTGGGYVFSDEYGAWVARGKVGDLPIHTADDTHYWNDSSDGKGNRFVAFLFAGLYHDFNIDNANTCPRSIHIGRKVGTISYTASTTGHIYDIIVTDGNELKGFNSGSYGQVWNNKVIIRNIKNHSIGPLVYLGSLTNIQEIYVQGDTISSFVLYGNYAGTYPNVTVSANNINGTLIRGQENYTIERCSIYIRTLNVTSTMYHARRYDSSMSNLFFYGIESLTGTSDMFYQLAHPLYVYFGYDDNDKKLSIEYNKVTSNNSRCTDVELRDGWCKNLNISTLTGLTKANVQAHIFDRLGVNDSGTTVTIHLAPAVYDLFTAEEIAAVTTRTSITIARG